MKRKRSKILAVLLSAVCAAACVAFLTACEDGQPAGEQSEFLFRHIENSLEYEITGIKTRDITDLEIPATYKGYPVTGLADYAFFNCTKLSEASIPDNIKYIGSHVFNGCTALNKVAIPAGTERIGSGVFSGCGNLTSVTVNADNTHFSSLNNCIVTKGSPYTLVAACAGSREIPFGEFNVIGDGACYGLAGISEVMLGDALISIGDEAFMACPDLTKIYALAAEFEGIGENAFKNCAKLSHIYLSENISSVGKDAFAGCANLTYYKYGAGYYLGNDVEYCIVLMSVNKDSVNGNFTVPDETRVIYQDVFGSAVKLTSVELPDGIKEIGENAFALSWLERIELPSSITVIKKGTFANIAHLEYVIAYGENIVIEDGAFDGCGVLQYADFRNGIKEVGNNAFRGAGKMIVFGGLRSARRIGDNAFERCMAMENFDELALAYELEHIGEKAFLSCRKISSIKLPASVKTIGEKAFEGCSNLHIMELSAAFSGSEEYLCGEVANQVSFRYFE